MIDRLSAELVTELAAAAPRISVIGDLIVDGWWDGHAERLSREAPAPVVEIADRSFAPGGAANTAAGLAALGARVRMIGIIGADDHGAILRRLLEERGIDTSHLIESDEAATIAKNRIVSGDQVLVRLDDGTRDGFTERDRDAVVAAAEDSATWAEAEVTSATTRAALSRATSSSAWPLATADRVRASSTRTICGTSLCSSPTSSRRTPRSSLSSAAISRATGRTGPCVTAVSCSRRRAPALLS